MSEFNMVCNFSRLDIKEEEPVVVYLLLPKEFYVGSTKPCIMERTSHLTSAEELYKPFFLPIRGRYNGWASIDKIKRDDNVLALEKFFGLKIEDVMTAAHINFPDSTVYEKDSLFYKKFFNDNILNSNIPLGEQFFKEVGMKYIDKFDGYGFSNVSGVFGNYLLKVKEGNTFELYKNPLFKQELELKNSFTVDLTEEVSKQKLSFIKSIYKYTNSLLGYSVQNTKRITVLKNLSLMFVLERYFDFAVTECGNKPGRREKGLTRRQEVEKDISSFTNILETIVTDEYRENVKDDIFSVTKDLVLTKERYKIMQEHHSYFGREFVSDDNMLTFSAYFDQIREGKCINHFVSNTLFIDTMYLLNVHFTPTLFGKSYMWMDKESFKFLCDIEEMKLKDIKSDMKQREE